MYCSIGLTTSGKDIFVDTHGWKELSVVKTFKGFSNDELLDALLATEAIHMQEIRRRSCDFIWLESIGAVEHYITEKLGQKEIETIKERRGISSAFAGFKYGQSLLHKNFRRRKTPHLHFLCRNMGKTICNA